MQVNGVKHDDLGAALIALQDYCQSAKTGDVVINHADCQWMRDRLIEIRNEQRVVEPPQKFPFEDFPEAIDAVRLGFKVMAHWADKGEISELIAASRDSGFEHPDVIAQIVMDALPSDPIENGRMSVSEKQRWTAIASFIGPDYISLWKKVGAFMDKVESF